MGMLINAEDAQGHQVLQKGGPQCSEQALLGQDGEVRVRTLSAQSLAG